MGEVAALILAAGRATRFGAGAGTKATALWRGKPLVRWVVEAAVASRVSRAIVVTGHAAKAVEAALAGLPIRVVANPAYASGMAGSLQAGVGAMPSSALGAVVLLADMPLVTPALIDALIARFEEDGRAADAVVPVFKGVLGNPVLLGRMLFPAVAALEGDAGARGLLAEPGRRVIRLPVADEAIGLDIDTRASLEALQKRR